MSAKEFRDASQRSSICPSVSTSWSSIISSPLQSFSDLSTLVRCDWRNVSYPEVKTQVKTPSKPVSFLAFGGRRSEWSLWSFAWTIGQWGQEWRATMKGCVLPPVFARSSLRLLWNLTWQKSSESSSWGMLLNNSYKVIEEYEEAYGGAVGIHFH